MKQTLKSGPTPTEWDPNALWTKSLRYAETMLERKDIDWEHALWSCLLLEHLARAALSNVHPTLLADEKFEVYNKFYALGLPIKKGKFSPISISIQEVFDRLNKLFDEFTLDDVRFCSSHMNLRNSEVHTGKFAFDNLAINTWPQFYKVCKILLKTMNKGLADLFNEEEVIVAEQLIATDADKSSSEIKKDVEAHKNVWLGKSNDERQNLSQTAMVWATKQEGHQVDCPACESKSLVFGESVGEIKKILEDDMIIERQEILPNAFQCVACGLKIHGLSRLIAVGLGNRFINTSTYPPMDYYAMEDPNWYYYEADNNEPF